MTSEILAEIELDISGLGIVMYSPSAIPAIKEGEDYLEANYREPRDVQRHIQAGSLVGFGTGSSGRFILRLRYGYPTIEQQRAVRFKLRLGVRCPDGVLVFRDLYDLMGWTSQFPPEQSI